MKSSSHKLLLSRTFQYLGIILVMAAMGGGYWYWKNAQAGVMQKSASKNGLVGYWSFDEGTGTQAGDASGNANTGTLTNGPTWVDGKLGKTVDFDGTNDYVTAGDIDAIDTATSLTYCVWVKHDSITTDDAIVEKSAVSTGDGSLLFRDDVGASSGRTDIYTWVVWDSTDADTTRIETPSGTSKLQIWTHVCGTYLANNANGLNLYVDGVGVADNPVSTVGISAINGGANPFTVGVRSDTTNMPYDGRIDEVRVYSRALSATEITNLYNLGAAKLQDTQSSQLTNGLMGYWSFNGPDISGTTAFDRSGKGNNGTLTNGTTKTIGKIGQGMQFDGTNDYVNLGTTSTAFNFANNLSASAWIKTSVSGRLIFQYQNSNPLVYMSVGGTTAGGTANKFVVYLRTNSGAVAVFNSNRSVNDNDWHHVAFTRDTSTQKVRLFIDGVLDLDSTYTDTGAIDTSGGDHRIGLHSQPAYAFSGSIDEPRVYNRALSAGEIWDLYQMGAADKINSAESQGDSLEKGMVGYWKLDDASGTSAADASGNANTGTLTNGPTWTTGRIGGGVNFDGTNDYIGMSSAATTATDNYTMTAWIYPANLNQLSAAVLNGLDDGVTGTQRGYAIGLGNGAGLSGGKLQGLLSNVAWIDSGYTFPSANAWYHIVMLRGAGTTKFYVNGVQTPNTFATAPGTPSNGFSIGSMTGIRYFNGSIDEVRVYNRALTAEEVTKLYKTTTPDNPETGLVGYWPFNGKDIAGTTAYDRSGKGNNGRIMNSPTKTIGKIGQGLSFDGTDDYISASGSQSVKTLSYWVRANGNANGGIELNANQYTYDNAIPAGWTSPTIYVDGVAKTTSYGSDIVTNGSFAANVTGWTTNYTMLPTWQNAVSGDGSTGYLRAPIASNANFDRFQGNGTIAANTSYLVSFWYRTSGITGNMRMGFTSSFATLANGYYGPYIVPSASWRFVSFTMTSTATSYPYFFFHKNGSIGTGSFDLDAVSIVPITTHYLITDTNWHHVVITTDTAVTASAVNIGEGGLRYLNGSLDEVRMYDHALSAAEVTALYNAGR